MKTQVPMNCGGDVDSVTSHLYMIGNSNVDHPMKIISAKDSRQRYLLGYARVSWNRYCLLSGINMA